MKLIQDPFRYDLKYCDVDHDGSEPTRCIERQIYETITAFENLMLHCVGAPCRGHLEGWVRILTSLFICGSFHPPLSSFHDHVIRTLVTGALRVRYKELIQEKPLMLSLLRRNRMIEKFTHLVRLIRLMSVTMYSVIAGDFLSCETFFFIDRCRVCNPIIVSNPAQSVVPPLSAF